MAIVKVCGHCGRIIDHSWSKDGLCWSCNQDKKLHRITTPYKSDMSITTKTCTCCGRERPLQMFYREDSDKCEDCEDWSNSSYPTKFRKCTKCGKELPLYMFTNSQICVDGVTTICRWCSSVNYNYATKRSDVRLICAEMDLFDEKIKYADWNGMPMQLFYKKHNGVTPMPRGVQRWLAVQEMAKKRGLVEDAKAEEVEPTPPSEPQPPFPNNENENEKGQTPRPGIFEPIEVRKDWFRQSIVNAVNAKKVECEPKAIKEFYLYWSELTPSGDIMRFELEKTWETANRLQRWYLSHKEYNQFSSPPQAVTPTPLKVEPTPPPPTPKVEQPVEQAAYSPQTLTIRFKAGDKVVRLKDGIFLLEQLSGNLKGSLSSKGAEILYETTDGDMVADKDLFKNKREALERTKLAGIPEERLTYGNKPIK